MTHRSNATRRLSVLVALLAANVMAAPLMPVIDREIVERLPADTGLASLRSVRAVRSLVAMEADNRDLAVRVAQIELARARDESDPRQLDQARAVVSPLSHLEEPPIPVLALRATISERVDEFSNALDDLEHVLRRDPGNAQARLTRATGKRCALPACMAA